MATTDDFFIHSLRPDEKMWTLKVLLLRKFNVESYVGKQKNGTLQKLIFLDDEGNKIQAIMFDDLIARFENVLQHNKSYLVSNGRVNKINTSYANVNNEIELVLQNYTHIKEDHSHAPTKNIVCTPIQFREATNTEFFRKRIDIVGVVAKVTATLMIPKRHGGYTQKREVVIVDKDFDTITLVLWGDMAVNEGQLLQQIACHKPIIAAMQFQPSEYQGQFQLSTTSISTIQVNPKCEQADDLGEWITSSKIENIEAMLLKNKINLAHHIQLKDIVHHQNSLPPHDFYTFNAIVSDIENKAQPYYNACKACKTKIFNFDEDAECPKCAYPAKEFTPRYNIRMAISDGQDAATVILFEDLATALIGCSIQDYIEDTTSTKGKEHSKFYQKMVAAKYKEYKFLIKLERITQASNGNPSMVPIAFEELPNKVQEEKTAPVSKSKLRNSTKKNASNQHNQESMTKGNNPDLIEIEDDTTIQAFKNKKRRPRKEASKLNIETTKKIKVEKD